MDSLPPVLAYLITQITKSLTAFIQPDSYLYWPYSVSTLLLAFYLGRVAFFNRKLWWHPSARQDYALYFANFLIVPALFTALYLNEAAVVHVFNALLGSASTHPYLSHTWGLRATFTFAIFVAYDLGRFLAHMLLHRLPALWEIHKVHHSAVVLTPMTAYRVHPFEVLLMNGIPLFFTGGMVWLFNHIFSAGISVYVFLGTHVILALLNFVDNLRHSPVWLTYGQALGLWIISPAHHQLHHSLEARHIGCNLGFALAVWDRMAGTLQVPSSKMENFRIGLAESSNPRYTGLLSLYGKPLVNAWRSLRSS